MVESSRERHSSLYYCNKLILSVVPAHHRLNLIYFGRLLCMYRILARGNLAT